MLGSSSESRRRKKDAERERDRDRDRDRERSSPKSKDKEKDKDRDKEKDRERRKSRSSRSSGIKKTRSSASKESKDDDDAADSIRTRLRASSSSTSIPKNLAVVPEMERRSSMGMSSTNGSRSSLSYPTFSKTHSKENIYARKGAIERRGSPFTPEPTDVDGEVNQEKENSRSPPPPTREAPVPPPARAPPSPPLTATNDLRKTASRNSIRHKDVDAIQKEMEGGRRSVDSGTRLTPDPRGGAASRSSVRDGEVEGTDLTSTTSSHPSTVRAKSPKTSSRTKTASPARTKSASASSSRHSTRRSTPVKVASRQASEVTMSTDSDATSVPPEHHTPRKVDTSPTNSEVSPASVVDSSPRTPTQHSVLPSVVAAQKMQQRPPTVEIVNDPMSRSQSVDSTYQQNFMAPPPPPPPPPAMIDPPRVDYLLQNGGLPRPVPRTLLAATDTNPVPGYSQYMSPRMDGPSGHDARQFFQPLQRLIDDYNAVIDTNGSLAVATGYRSVARRLLDRLEAVFARNISSEYCPCIMCLDQPIHDDSAGVNWGEILELVSGRCDLPSWPPLEQAANGLGIADLEDPCQRIDVDVPEQYRQHYAQQSRKTKVAVQSWLSNQQDGVPEDADDETLTFAMLTRLEQQQRPLFYAILYGMQELPNPRTRPEDKSIPPSLAKAGLALQRLYRLSTLR